MFYCCMMNEVIRRSVIRTFRGSRACPEMRDLQSSVRPGREITFADSGFVTGARCWAHVATENTPIHYGTPDPKAGQEL